MSERSRREDVAGDGIRRSNLKTLAAHAAYAGKLRELDSDVSNVTIRRAPASVKRHAPSRARSDTAYDEESRALAEDWHRLHRLETCDPQRLRMAMEFVYKFSHAGSAVLSVLRPNESGHLDCEWQVVCGGLAEHEGDGTPRKFSPCGLCLDAGYPMFLSHPEKKFDYLGRIQPTLFETLIIPLYSDRGAELGTCWVTHHDPAARFNINDVNILERASGYLARSLQ
jgi:hypothetical protein